MFSEDWCNGEGQRAAAKRYSAVERLMYERHRVLSSDLREYVSANYPELLPALDGLPCPALAGVK